MKLVQHNFATPPDGMGGKAVTVFDGRTQINGGVTCPKCGGLHSKVKDSRGAVIKGSLTVRRRRHCDTCREKWATLEINEALATDLLSKDPPSRADAIWKLALELTAHLKAERG